VLMFCGEIADNRPVACLTTQVHPHETMTHPTSRRMLHPLSLVVGKCRRMVFERLADTVCQGRLHQQT
jgi:hypothetical protein